MAWLWQRLRRTPSVGLSQPARRLKPLDGDEDDVPLTSVVPAWSRTRDHDPTGRLRVKFSHSAVLRILPIRKRASDTAQAGADKKEVNERTRTAAAPFLIRSGSGTAGCPALSPARGAGKGVALHSAFQISWLLYVATRERRAVRAAACPSPSRFSTLEQVLFIINYKR
jgi:hypothetical protein